MWNGRDAPRTSIASSMGKIGSVGVSGAAPGAGFLRADCAQEGSQPINIATIEIPHASRLGHMHFSLIGFLSGAAKLRQSPEGPHRPMPYVTRAHNGRARC